MMIYNKFNYIQRWFWKIYRKRKGRYRKSWFTKNNSNKNAEIYYDHKTIEDLLPLKDEIKNLKEDNNKLNAKYQFLETEVRELKEKVEFMEPIVLSKIYRKAINYSIIKILEKYKTKVKVTIINLPKNEMILIKKTLLLILWITLV